jgi:hypothetical protein
MLKITTNDKIFIAIASVLKTIAMIIGGFRKCSQLRSSSVGSPLNESNQFPNIVSLIPSMFIFDRFLNAVNHALSSSDSSRPKSNEKPPSGAVVVMDDCMVVSVLYMMRVMSCRA